MEFADLFSLNAGTRPGKLNTSPTDFYGKRKIAINYSFDNLGSPIEIRG
jgi:hypothetical protein